MQWILECFVILINKRRWIEKRRVFQSFCVCGSLNAMLAVALRSCNVFEEIYGIRRKMTKREMGLFFFFLEKLLV